MGRVPGIFRCEPSSLAGVLYLVAGERLLERATG